MIFSALSKREHRMLYLTLFIVVSCLGYNFVLEPIGQRWMQVNRQIMAKEVKLKKALKTIKERKAIELEYARYKDYIQMQGSDEEEVAGLLSEIDKLARDSAVHLTDIRPVTVQDLSFYKRFAVEAECESPMETLARFIYALHTSPQLLKVEKLRLNTKTGQSGALRSSLLITRVLIP